MQEQRFARGIDVSYWQRGMRWPEVPADVRFVFMRASVGGRRDATAALHYAAAEGRARGPYHYLTLVDARRQADVFAAAVAARRWELQPVLDVEEPGLSRELVLACAERYAELTGKRLMVYTRASFWNRLAGADRLGTGERLWVAHWHALQPIVPAAWPEWTFWQYSNRGEMGGCRVDMNLFRGTAEELAAMVW